MGVVSSCLKLIMATGAELQDFYETALKVSREAGQVNNRLSTLIC